MLEFLKMMPLQNGPRQALSSAFPGAFVATCASGRCQVVAHGNAASAVMEVTIDGIVNPTLVLSPTVTASFVMRGAHAVEFCGIDGLDVSQFIFSRTVQGLRLSLDAGLPHLNVNIDDDGDNYTCN